METKKLYYVNSHLSQFFGRVLCCQPCDRGFEVILDQTAFYLSLIHI